MKQPTKITTYTLELLISGERRGNPPSGFPTLSNGVPHSYPMKSRHNLTLALTSCSGKGSYSRAEVSCVRNLAKKSTNIYQIPTFSTLTSEDVAAPLIIAVETKGVL